MERGRKREEWKRRGKKEGRKGMRRDDLRIRNGL